MATPKKKIMAICQTLAASAESGLNASLTSDDCRELLQVIHSAMRARKPTGKTIDHIVESVAEMARDVFDGIADDFTGRPPRRGKRK